MDSASESEKEVLFQQMMSEAEQTNDSGLEFTAGRVANGESEQLLRNLLLRRAQLERRTPEGTSANAKAKEILQNPVFQDSENREGSNWMKRALERLGDLLKPKERELQESPNINMTPPGAINLGGIFPFILGVLILGLLVAIVFAFRNVSFKKSEKAKKARGGMLEEDEPIRSHDEWLTLADQLESQGKYREAIRCLYLAILMRLDESRVVRFERTETNWEHLTRIEPSMAPKEINYRSLTQKFDLVWYGNRPCNSDDTKSFRSEYLSLVELLGRKTA